MDKFHTALEKAESSQQDQNSLLKGTIYSNMAQTLLDDQEIDDSSLKKASKYAKESMLIYQQGSSSSGISEPERKVGFGRALSLVAACYEKADSAILAEGLYQTSIENFSDRHPLSKISHAGILNYYAKLCKKWDKREADAASLEKNSSDVISSLPQNWRNKNPIIGGLLVPNKI